MVSPTMTQIKLMILLLTALAGQSTLGKTSTSLCCSVRTCHHCVWGGCVRACMRAGVRAYVSLCGTVCVTVCHCVCACVRAVRGCVRVYHCVALCVALCVQVCVYARACVLTIWLMLGMMFPK